MLENLLPSHEKARACKLRRPRATRASGGASAERVPGEPLLNCCHCGAVVGLQIWPPKEPVLAGPCPGCGGWLSVDFSEAGQSLPLLVARSAASQSNAEILPREVIRPASWNRRSGTMNPLFVPHLVRQGKLLEIDNPATWKQSTPARAAAVRGLPRRVKFFGAAACLSALLGAALPAGHTAPRPSRLTEEGEAGKSPRLIDSHKPVGVGSAAPAGLEIQPLSLRK
jgi:hypothetical protein